MLHPILKNTSALFVFGILSFISAGVYFLLSFFYANSALLFSIIDAIVSFIIYALISLGLWYTIRFGFHKKQKNVFFFLRHLMLYSLSVIVWVLSTLGIILVINIDFLHVFIQMLPLKLMIGFLLYVITLLAYYMLIYHESHTQKMENEHNLKNLIREAQLNELRSQLHPHFLFNSLNSINSLTISNPQKAGEMIVKLSEFLRYSLSRKGHSMTSFENELHHIHLYLDIEKIRFGKRLEFVSEVCNKSLLMDMPLMLLQPLIENAVKHGVYNTQDTVAIKLHAIVGDDGMLKITIQNNMDDTEGNKPIKGTGTGLQNVTQRMQLVYGNTGLFKHEMINGLFTAILHIPEMKKTNIHK
jgi:two-component system, LytTR family, sensor kinase